MQRGWTTQCWGSQGSDGFGGLGLTCSVLAGIMNGEDGRKYCVLSLFRGCY